MFLGKLLGRTGEVFRRSARTPEQCPGQSAATGMNARDSAHTAGMSRFIRNDDAADIAWKLFEETGSLHYYMLYKQLKK